MRSRYFDVGFAFGEPVHASVPVFGISSFFCTSKLLICIRVLVQPIKPYDITEITNEPIKRIMLYTHSAKSDSQSIKIFVVFQANNATKWHVPHTVRMTVLSKGNAT